MLSDFIAVNKEDTYKVSGVLVGRYKDKRVFRSTEAPECDFENMTDMEIEIDQFCLPEGCKDKVKLGIILEALNLKEELGASAENAESINELRLMKEIADLQDAFYSLLEEVNSIA